MNLNLIPGKILEYIIKGVVSKHLEKDSVMTKKAWFVKNRSPRLYSIPFLSGLLDHENIKAIINLRFSKVFMKSLMLFLWKRGKDMG